MKILFLGDIVGKEGRNTVENFLPSLVETYSPDFIIANAENAAAGIGITPDIADSLLNLGIDLITLGNHTFAKKEAYEYLNKESRIIRPANYPAGVPGKGHVLVKKNQKELAVINLCGRVFMAEYDDPFRCAERLIEEIGNKPILVDFHAEATSEKNALGWYLDGKITAMVGTHTHVQTADERILHKGTAYISDVGMCGSRDSIIGMEKEGVLRRFLTLMPERFEPAVGAGIVSGVVITCNETGKAENIERILWKDAN